MSLKHTLTELFSLSKKERIAFVVLLIAIAGIAVLPFIKRQSAAAGNTPVDTAWMAQASLLLKNDRDSRVAVGTGDNDADVQNYQQDYESVGSAGKTQGVLFQFDPNTLEADGFKKLGLRDKTIRTLLNYRNKGGKFRKPDDLAKIYGLRQEEFQRLQPYISIAVPQNRNTSSKYTNSSDYRENFSAREIEPKPKYKLKVIEINSADAIAYESLYGIGAKLAARILNFREKLGGFYSVDQVGETYGVPDSTFQKIKAQLQVNAELIKKMNINTAGFDELNNHPYINSKTAYQILKFRKEKGSFSTIDEIRNLVQPNDEFDRIGRYVSVE